jgi:hypothetical protein
LVARRTRFHQGRKLNTVIPVVAWEQGPNIYPQKRVLKMSSDFPSSLPLPPPPPPLLRIGISSSLAYRSCCVCVLQYHINTRTHTHTYTHTYIHTYIHTYTHTHIHADTPSHKCSSRITHDNTQRHTHTHIPTSNQKTHCMHTTQTHATNNTSRATSIRQMVNHTCSMMFASVTAMVVGRRYVMSVVVGHVMNHVAGCRCLSQHNTSMLCNVTGSPRLHSRLP